jgi:hypothetical protein
VRSWSITTQQSYTPSEDQTICVRDYNTSEFNPLDKMPNDYDALELAFMNTGFPNDEDHSIIEVS